MLHVVCGYSVCGMGFLKGFIMINGWKTFVFGLALAIFGALEQFDFTQYLDADNAGTVTGIIGFVVIVLRAVTNSPIFKKAE